MRREGNEAVELKAVTADNWLQCINLKLAQGQSGFVSSNLYSLAQSKVEPCRVPRAIYAASDALVGFALYTECPLADGTYRISRLMIDVAFQGRGYARQAAVQIIALMRQIDGCSEIFLDYAPNNPAAEKLWTSLGFEPCGHEGNNILAKLPIR